MSGERNEAQNIIKELMRQSTERYVAPYFIATIHAGLEAKEQAFQWLEKVYEERSFYVFEATHERSVIDALRIVVKCLRHLYRNSHCGVSNDRRSEYAILFAATLLCARKLPSPAYPISTFPD